MEPVSKNRPIHDGTNSKIAAKRKATVLSQALPYIKKFNNKVVVVKLGGSALTEKNLCLSFAHDVTWLNSVGIKVLVVHGGGPHIEKHLKKLGIPVNFFEGTRITDSETLDVVEMVLAGNVNKEVVELINQSGGKAVGLTCQDGNLIKARKKRAKRTKNNVCVDFGLVGDVDSVNTDLLLTLMGDNFVPVVAPIASGERGETYNINADIVAGKLSENLKAEKLILMTNTIGVLDGEGNLIPEMNGKTIRDLIEKKAISEGMIPKVEAALRASELGVKAVHIIDGRLENSLLLEVLTDSGIGTMIQA